MSSLDKRLGSSIPELPDETTDAGAMTRLFLAEVAVPRDGDMAEARRAMDWMRCVLMNRLKHPSDFGADKSATQVVQIISASGYAVQFRGFENYPHIGAAQKNNIDGKMSAAAGEPGFDQGTYSSFVKTAIAAATDPPPVDPTATGLYFWVTSGTHSPDPSAVMFQGLGGNSFYTWNRSSQKHHHPHHVDSQLAPPRNGPLIYADKRPVSK